MSYHEWTRPWPICFWISLLHFIPNQCVQADSNRMYNNICSFANPRLYACEKKFNHLDHLIPNLNRIVWYWQLWTGLQYAVGITVEAVLATNCSSMVRWVLIVRSPSSEYLYLQGCLFFLLSTWVFKIVTVYLYAFLGYVHRDVTTTTLIDCHISMYAYLSITHLINGNGFSKYVKLI